ncbi:hypothetical protein VTN00DRAFT_1620 [Thermoascus crustaceus]|uniref:uncharacterized protein n=1 Tax=Thermoascus crustaceus TaxID=5088 RepID=UPI003743C5AE
MPLAFEAKAVHFEFAAFPAQHRALQIGATMNSADSLAPPCVTWTHSPIRRCWMLHHVSVWLSYPANGTTDVIRVPSSQPEHISALAPGNLSMSPALGRWYPKILSSPPDQHIVAKCYKKARNPSGFSIDRVSVGYSCKEGASEDRRKTSGKSPSAPLAPNMATIVDDDERLLARIGYKQELRREFSKWSTVSYAISILGVLGSVPATFGAPLEAGGPATAVWCWFFGSCMALCIGSSVAELVSAYPTAGGMYFVTKHVVPEDQVAIFSWIQGWCNLLGQTAGVSSVAYTVSQMMLACASMNSSLKDGKYTYSPMSEETHDAAIRGPVAIQTAVLVSGAFGWMLTVSMCFCLNDFEQILNTPTGLPAAQIFLNAGGKTGGTIMWFFAILVQFFTGCSAMLADTRMAYAFARDDALPFSDVFAKVNEYTHTPVNAVWFVVFFSICLNCIAIGSTQTATAIFNITAPALDLSYIAVILAHQMYKNKVKFIEGPFTLGRWGTPINIVSIVWVIFISIVLFFPPSKPVTVANMNYAICVAAFIAIFALSWWWLSARRKYIGPRTSDIIQRIRTEDYEEIYDPPNNFEV